MGWIWYRNFVGSWSVVGVKRNMARNLRRTGGEPAERPRAAPPPRDPAGGAAPFDVLLAAATEPLRPPPPAAPAPALLAMDGGDASDADSDGLPHSLFRTQLEAKAKRAKTAAKKPLYVQFRQALERKQGAANAVSKATPFHRVRCPGLEAKEDDDVKLSVVVRSLGLVDFSEETGLPVVGTNPLDRCDRCALGLVCRMDDPEATCHVYTSSKHPCVVLAFKGDAATILERLRSQTPKPYPGPPFAAAPQIAAAGPPSPATLATTPAAPLGGGLAAIGGTPAAMPQTPAPTPPGTLAAGGLGGLGGQPPGAPGTAPPGIATPALAPGLAAATAPPTHAFGGGFKPSPATPATALAGLFGAAATPATAGAGGVDLLGAATIPRVQRKEKRRENAANMQRLHEIRAEFEKLAPVIAQCCAGHLPTADYDAVAMQVLRESKVPAGWGAFVRIEDGGAVVVDERRAADFFQKNNNYDFKKYLPSSQGLQTGATPALGAAGRAASMAAAMGAGIGDGIKQALGPLLAQNRATEATAAPPAAAAAAPPAVSPRAHSSNDRAARLSGMGTNGARLKAFSKQVLDALKGKNRKVWASVRVELGKDRPEPSLNRFFVDAVDEASAPESIADDLIDMAAALFPGQDFTA